MRHERLRGLARGLHVTNVFGSIPHMVCSTFYFPCMRFKRLLRLLGVMS